MDNNQIIQMLRDLQEAQRDDTRYLCSQISSLKDSIDKRLSDLEENASFCKKNWDLMGKILNWSFGGVSVASVMAWIFSAHK